MSKPIDDDDDDQDRAAKSKAVKDQRFQERDNLNDKVFLLALYHLGKHDRVKYFPLEQIGEEAGISKPSHWPIAQRLATHGLIEYPEDESLNYRLTNQGRLRVESYI
jgi:Mn-dependent DtxR family transcriptional regulator